MAGRDPVGHRRTGRVALRQAGRPHLAGGECPGLGPLHIIPANLFSIAAGQCFDNRAGHARAPHTHRTWTAVRPYTHDDDDDDDDAPPPAGRAVRRCCRRPPATNRGECAAPPLLSRRGRSCCQPDPSLCAAVVATDLPPATTQGHHRWKDTGSLQGDQQEHHRAAPTATVGVGLCVSVGVPAVMCCVIHNTSTARQGSAHPAGKREDRGTAGGPPRLNAE